MITQRRVFQAKVGAAGAVVAKMKEVQPMFEAHGGPAARVYTDFMSGSTDRVVWEFDAENLGQMEAIFGEVMQDPKYQKAFEEWFSSLTQLIDGATVEPWNREV